MSYSDEDETIWEPEKDPLEIDEEIYIKNERIDIKPEPSDPEDNYDDDSVIENQISIKKEKSVDSDDIPVLDQLASIGDYEVVNVQDFMNKKICNVVSSTSKSENTKVIARSMAPSISNSILDGSTEEAPGTSCKCMRYIENYCSKCDKAIFYRTDITQCLDCKTLLKLQCRKCHKKYKFLNSVQQYALQTSKRLNLLSTPNKQVVFNCVKSVTFVCSSCNFKSTERNLLDAHVQRYHAKSSFNAEADDARFFEFKCMKCYKVCKDREEDSNTDQVCADCGGAMVYRCLLCNRLYKRLKNVRNHMKTAWWHSKTTFPCSFCDYKAVTKAKLEFHIKGNHTSAKNPTCEAEFEDANVLETHLATNLHQGLDGAKDDRGDKKTKHQNFSQDISVNNEDNSSYSTHSDDNYTILKNDPEVLIKKLRKKLSRGRQAADSSSLVDYFCIVCGKVSKKKFSALKPRCPKCKGKFDYRCISCEKLYGSYACVDKHVNHECKERFTLQCILCDFSNARRDVLINHIKHKHTIYKCKLCDDRCDGYASLKRHQASDCTLGDENAEINFDKLIGLYCNRCCKGTTMTIDDEVISCKICRDAALYVCLKCSKMFDNRDFTLKHLQEECVPNYYCNKCDFKAYTRYDLDEHVGYVHTRRKCPECGVLFRDKEIYRQHRLEEMRRKQQRRKGLGCGLSNKLPAKTFDE